VARRQIARSAPAIGQNRPYRFGDGTQHLMSKETKQTATAERRQIHGYRVHCGVATRQLTPSLRLGPRTRSQVAPRR
jgi:hypothetical protein